jgi:large subunit ribosomal protein L22
MENKENKTNIEVVARARSLPISHKRATEVARMIKGKNVDKAIKELELVLTGKIAVPYKRYMKDVPHRKGKKIAAGRYPRKTASYFIMLINSLKKNADAQGLNGNNLLITKAITCKGALRWHYGRKRGVRIKNTHLEIYGVESEVTKK